MPDPDLNFIAARLDRIQSEFRDLRLEMRLRDEQREASHQALMQTLTRQMVEVSVGLEKHLGGMDERLDGMDERLDGMDDRLAAVDEGLVRVEQVLQQIAARIGGGSSPN